LQIKLKHVGVCGSDLHFYKEGRLANWELDGPLALGHEPGGIVSAIGEGVEGFEIGDKVALEPGVPCGECEDCRKGHYNLCKHIKFMAIPHEKDGVFAEYCVHSASMCYKLPENVDTMEGGLMEPLSVALHATELSNAKIGETAIVLGSGCIGLCTVMALKARGVSEIYVTDVVDKRLEKALEVGATRVFNSQRKTLWSLQKLCRRRCGSGLRMCGKPCDNSADMQTDQTCRKSHIGWCVTGACFGTGYRHFERNGRYRIFRISLQKYVSYCNSSRVFRSNSA